MCVCMCMCVHVFAYVCVFTCVCVCVYVCVCVCVCTRIHVHVHTCTCVAVPGRKQELYFDCVTAFETRYLQTSTKGGAHTRCLAVSIVAASTQRISAPPLTEVQRYCTSNTVTGSKYVTGKCLFSTRPGTATYYAHYISVSPQGGYQGAPPSPLS